MKKTIYDISLPISESIAVWPGDDPVKIRQTRHIEKGDNSTVSRLSLGAHVGTHVDAPAHFIQNGKSVDSLDLNILVGKAFVVEALNVETISVDALESFDIPNDCDRILFHTKNSDLWGGFMSDPVKDECAHPAHHHLHICQLKKKGLAEDIATRCDDPGYICHNCNAMANRAEDLCNCSPLVKKP